MRVLKTVGSIANFLQKNLDKKSSQSGHIAHPLGFLVCRSIELGFKRFYGEKSYSEKDFRRLSHDLSRLYECAKKEGLSNYFRLDSEQAATLSRVNEWYRAKNFEYPRGFLVPISSFEPINLSDKLLLGIQEFCKENISLHHNTPLAN